MIKNIKYSGYSATPSDYVSVDGDLSLSLNVINEDSQLRPTGSPTEILTLQADEKLLFIHKVPGQINYIFARKNGESLDLYWQSKSATATNTTAAQFITSIKGFKDIAAIGNTLSLALDSGLSYLLWKDNGYKLLGNRPPFVSIDFGMCKVETLSKSHNCKIPWTCSPHAVNSHRHADKTELARMTEILYGFLNPTLSESVTSKGFFYQPFFLRYAYRLYDGSYSWHSAPILMLPSITPPIVKYSDSGSGDSETVDTTLTLSIPYFSLVYRILSDVENELSQWADIISGIDVFVSAPIYTYDQSKDLTSGTTRARAMLLGLTDYNPLRPGGNTDNEVSAGRAANVAPTDVFVGHYGEDITGKFIDHTMSTLVADDFTMINISLHDRFHDNIRNAHEFYKIAEIDIKDIKAMSGLENLDLAVSDMSNLVARPTLPDDYQSHCNLVASSLYAFNSRLNLAGLTLLPAEPLPIRSCMQFGNPDGTSVSTAKITVYTRLNGVKCHSVHVGKNGNNPDVWFNPTTNFPRYIYYPDASAYKMEIILSSSLKYVINLTPHDFLNGAYYFNDSFKVESLPENSAEAETEASLDSVPIGSKIYTSEVNNPFYFPLLGINAIGSGEIYRVCSAVKALSQGQFGQFPLYAFSSDGIWALETNSNGSYSAKQPISRDVCINPKSITQIDSAVLFATDRGIMLISGSQVQCISDIINSDYPFDISVLPGIKTLHTALGHGSDSCIRIKPFSEFLSNCSMLYDYTHQHIVVFSPQADYAYLYSLKSKSWGMIHSDLEYNVNSYPETLAVNSAHKVVDFSNSSETVKPGLILTRPIKLDAPDVLKTIDTVIQHGYFRRGHVKSVLYGSRDLFSWHLVVSSKNHILRGFRGTPFKYFIIALLLDFAADESLFDATIKFTQRLINQPR